MPENTLSCSKNKKKYFLLYVSGILQCIFVFSNILPNAYASTTSNNRGLKTFQDLKDVKGEPRIQDLPSDIRRNANVERDLSSLEKKTDKDDRGDPRLSSIQSKDGIAEKKSSRGFDGLSGVQGTKRDPDLQITQEANVTNKSFTTEDKLSNPVPLISAPQLPIAVVLQPVYAINETTKTVRSTVYLKEQDYHNRTSVTLQARPLTKFLKELNREGITNNTKIFNHKASNTNVTSSSIYIQPYYENITELLFQFGRVDAALQDAISIFSAKRFQSFEQKPKSMVKESSVLDRPPKCNVSKDQLTGLINTTNTALSSDTTIKSPINCQLNPSNLDNCNELMKQIQCGIQHLNNGYKAAVEKGRSLDDVTKWKNAYDDVFEKYKKAIDDVKASVSQENKQKLDTLKTEIQKLANESNSRLEKLQKEKQQHEFTIKKLCISEISSGKISDAIKYFKELKNDSILDEIIEAAYTDYGKLDNLNNILEFIRTLPYVSQVSIAYQSLFSQMEKHNHLYSPQLFKFDLAVKQSMNAKPSEVKLIHIKNKLATSVVRVITSFAKNRDYEQIKFYFNQYHPCAVNKIDDYLSNVTQNIYANNLGNFKTTLEFIESLGWLHKMLQGYDALLSEMEKNNHLDSSQLISLAYKVKHRKGDSEHPSNDDKCDTQELRAGFEVLKNRFSSGVRGLIWNGDRCTMYDRRRQEYLYAASFNRNSLVSMLERYVFTWIPGNPVIEGDWQLVPVNYGEFFTIRNIYWNEYLYPASSRYNNERRCVFTWILKDPVGWQLVPVNNGEFFTIRNIYYNEYLYADGSYTYNNKRRYVFTWRYTPLEGTMKLESQWKINCGYISAA